MICDKTKYGSYKEAQDAIKAIAAKNKKPMKVYKCIECGGFHIATIHHNRKKHLDDFKYKADYSLVTPIKKRVTVNTNLSMKGYGNPLSTYKPFEKLKLPPP